MKRVIIPALFLACGAVNADITGLTETFNGESAELNSIDFANWDVINGTVDTVASGDFGIDCVGGSGNCIDLDGSTFETGTMRTRQPFAIGTYELKFSLAGSFVAGFPDDIVSVTFGDYFQQFVIDSEALYSTYTVTVNVTSTNERKLTIAAAVPVGESADNAGATLDNVFVTLLSCPGPDADGDGICDTADNCTLVANADQSDTDGDGHGNRCDAVFDNSCLVNGSDLGIFKAAFFTADPLTDMDGSGLVNGVDLGLFKAAFFGEPGPSAAGALCNL